MKSDKAPGASKSPLGGDRPFYLSGPMLSIIGIAAVLVILLLVFAGPTPAGQGATVPPAPCAAKVLQYINTNLVRQGTTATLVSTAENKEMYNIKVSYQGQETPLYATKDCSLLFTGAIDMNAAPAAAAGGCGTASAQATPARKEPVKTEKPLAELFVMSFCPYGTQAEAALRPVFDLLGSKADIRIRYITTVKGTTADSVDSLHGPVESAEDLQQVCINKYHPAKMWAYIKAFNEQCYPDWRDPAKLAACRKAVITNLTLDSTKIDACATGAEGVGLLKADEALTTRYGASTSPTFIINGVEYSGSRTPDAYKQAICNSFNAPPAECQTVLAPQQAAAAASGGCG